MQRDGEIGRRTGRSLNTTCPLAGPTCRVNARAGSQRWHAGSNPAPAINNQAWWTPPAGGNTPRTHLPHRGRSPRVLVQVRFQRPPRQARSRNKQRSSSVSIISYRAHPPLHGRVAAKRREGTLDGVAQRQSIGSLATGDFPRRPLARHAGRRIEGYLAPRGPEVRLLPLSPWRAVSVSTAA